MTPFVAAQAMLDNIPEVQARTRVMRRSTTILVGNRQFPQRVEFVDPNFLQVIQLPLVAGDPGKVFRPASAVLTKHGAQIFRRRLARRKNDRDERSSDATGPKIVRCNCRR